MAGYRDARSARASGHAPGRAAPAADRRLSGQRGRSLAPARADAGDDPRSRRAGAGDPACSPQPGRCGAAACEMRCARSRAYAPAGRAGVREDRWQSVLHHPVPDRAWRRRRCWRSITARRAWTWDLPRISAKGFTDNVGGSHGREAEPPARRDPEGARSTWLASAMSPRSATLALVHGRPRKRSMRNSGTPFVLAWSCARTARTRSSTTGSRRPPMRSSRKASAPRRIFGLADCSRRRPRRKSSKRHLRHRESVRPRRGADHFTGGARASRRAQPHGGQACQGVNRLCLCAAVFCHRSALC